MLLLTALASRWRCGHPKILYFYFKGTVFSALFMRLLLSSKRLNMTGGLDASACSQEEHVIQSLHPRLRATQDTSTKLQI